MANEMSFEEAQKNLLEILGPDMSKAVATAQQIMLEIMGVLSEKYPEKEGVDGGIEATAVVVALGGLYNSFLVGLEKQGHEHGKDVTQTVKFLAQVLGESAFLAFSEKMRNQAKA